ncbi:MAG: DUF3179 domain-containing protein [Thermoleophilia bacterium]
MSRSTVLALVLVAAALVMGGAFAATRGGDDEPAPGASGPADGAGLSVSTAGWKTDFTRHSVPLDEFISGGPPRDGIPPIDDPRFAPVAESDGEDREPVIALEVGGEARAYPIRVLIWHEIVNDTVGGRAVAVTFCPLCNTSIVFDRELDGRTLRFGTTGNLRLSDLVMWDDATESWWQQFSGEAVVGELTGERLERIPSQLISLAEFRERHPDGVVLTEETGHDRPYGRNPYTGYDDVDSPAFLLRGRDPDGRLPPKERVVSVEDGTALAAVPFPALERRRVIDATVGTTPFTVWWSPGTASALDADAIVDGRDVGSAVVYDRRLDGRLLSFGARDGRVRDAQTGSSWGRDGRAVSGPLAGRRLTPVAHDAPFWFAVAAFRPDARIVTGA